ncbi:MAG: alpha-galactosidase [Bacteroidetes bacterium]|nr:alpha-galactosidase [Bacteroidota bacterium]
MRKILFIAAITLTNIIYAQNFYEVSGSNIRLNNGVLKRIISFSHDSLYSHELLLQGDSNNFIRTSKDFSFSINNEKLDGYTGWELISTSSIHDDHDGAGIKIIIKGKNKWRGIQVDLNYLLYPKLPVIRKWIGITNNSPADINVQALDVEDLQTELSQVSSVVYNNYGRMKELGHFVGTWDDPVVVVHDITQRRGMALGNEAPGVLKRTAFHTQQDNIEVGMMMPGQDFPFRKWLKHGESWTSPKTFICIYANRDNGYEVINREVNEFIVTCMRPRIINLKQKPTFVYNTWNPFRTFINDSMIRKVAKAASECGVQEFIIDDGWQLNAGASSSTKGWGTNYGDWLVDKNKFPLGLKSTFDFIRSLGMKPGLWISIGSATSDSKVFKEHPEWFVENNFNKPGNLHLAEAGSGFYSSCFGTGWFDYIKQVILRLVKDYGLAYAKLDLSVITSAYTNDKKISGCYSKNHPLHRDHEESFIVIYQRVLQLFDELHAEAPELFIDCTFETAGKLQLMDYAIAQHAEGNWLSNFEEPSPIGPLRIRQMAWWRSPALPASSLVIGNLQMNDPDFEFGLKSLIGTLPIVLGDPRELSEDKKATIKKWSSWMQNMQGKFNYMNYRKDLPGIGEPQEGFFDGWMRINFENHTGGIFGVFRQGALENSRKIFLTDLDMDKNYVIRLAPNGDQVFKATGKEIMERGFVVEFEKLYDGKIYEIGVE